MQIGLQLRYGTAAEWTADNPVLAIGEEGHETDTGKRKVGDGTTAWTALAYWSGGGAVTAHAAQHASGQPDAVTPASIGAATAAQGALAASALQPNGNGSQLSGITPGQVGAYRTQAVANSASVSGAVTPGFASALLLQYALTGNLTSLAEPTGLADGETAAIWITLGAYGMMSKPDATATAKWGPWTVTGPIVRVGVQRLGSVYYWTAVSF